MKTQPFFDEHKGKNEDQSQYHGWLLTQNLNVWRNPKTFVANPKDKKDLFNYKSRSHVMGSLSGFNSHNIASKMYDNTSKGYK